MIVLPNKHGDQPDTRLSSSTGHEARALVAPSCAMSGAGPAGLAATVAGLATFGGGTAAVAQSDDKLTETEAGIPVTDKLVVEKCGTCHTPDGKGNLSRISWSRTTPEGWAQAIHRMVKLNGLSIGDGRG
jgi:quinohemoprotein amine dehydrogenase